MTEAVMISRRLRRPELEEALKSGGLPDLLARLYAARGIADPEEADASLKRLLPPATLLHAERMASLLADAIAAGKKLLIIADYDSDGATACAIGLRGLRMFGATVDYLVPNRFEYGYGLTPEIVHLAYSRNPRPDILVTVDNGIASHAGVDEANQLGLQVLVTDHHLPTETPPEATCIVNPNQHGCTFASKNLAGCGVIFYVLLALRAELRKRGAYPDGKEPNLGTLTDLVALGTIADVVKLDQNNRILVAQGLNRIRHGAACPGINALMTVARRNTARASAMDLAFQLGPRLNAAGRLDDMSIGIECLISDDPRRAMQLASQLDEINRQRREIESGMKDEALAVLLGVEVTDRSSIVLYHPEWHQGVIGIVASRIKEQYNRPVIVFAQDKNGLIKGSGRSINGIHLRDALDVVTKRQPDLIKKFGGHAMAAGLTIAEDSLALFGDLFEEVCQTQMTPAILERRLETDGELSEEEFSIDHALLLAATVWGQGFPAPLFEGRFMVEHQRIVGEKHLKLRLGHHGRSFDAILFNDCGPLPADIEAVFALDANEFNGEITLQLRIEHWQSAGSDV